ncbi:hypothetical protein CROQUDRAFT_724112 [Cronartium quercuum f. sp. fusiforme G11]|uniref:AB hydrolase-1 domain-containing protein n=1 Tax=Cronartium quercuum f. sp. fusiforme G11 TaxID=708437 RepID=A0A9P6TA26_9BASI|nr:hypothetical protein CROQUDRAFT_724112 [Cronartium quercuum f. sp. fusiforme G11]
MSHTTIPPPFHLYSQTTLSILHPLLRTLHVLIRFSAPISHLSTISFIVFVCLQPLPSNPIHFWALACLFTYSLADSIYHLYFLYCLRLLNSPDFASPLIYPTPSERERVLRGVLSSFQNGTQIRECLSQWFYRSGPGPSNWDGRSGAVEFEEIRKENLKELIASILFSSTPEDLDKARTAELEEDLDWVASVLDHVFPEGRDESIHCMRMNLEPIKAEHRPLMFYLLIRILRIFVNVCYYIVGFRRGTIRTEGGPFNYWYHPGTLNPTQSSPRPVPIVVISGLGGIFTLFHYAIGLLWRTQRPMFLVGNESVSLNMFSTVHKVSQSGSSKQDLDQYTDRDERGTRWLTISHASKMRPLVLTLDEQALGLRKMFRRHGFCTVSESSEKQQGGAFIIGHSLGTLLTSYFDREESDWVAGTIAIDPISVLTFLPDLVRTFVYATPQTVAELLVRLIAREIGICTVIQRHFHWFQFVTLEPTSRTHYILSEEDALVNHQKVAEYLTRHSIPTTTLERTPHGGFLFHHLPAVLERTCSLINEGSPKAPFIPSRLPKKRTSRISFQFPSPVLFHNPHLSPISTIKNSSALNQAQNQIQSPSSPLLLSSGSVGMTVSFSFTSPPIMLELENSPPPPPSPPPTRRRITRRLSSNYSLTKIS